MVSNKTKNNIKTKKVIADYQNKFYTTLDLASIFGISLKTVTRYINRGIFKCVGVSRDTGVKLFEKDAIRYIRPFLRFHIKYFSVGNRNAKQ